MSASAFLWTWSRILDANHFADDASVSVRVCPALRGVVGEFLRLQCPGGATAEAGLARFVAEVRTATGASERGSFAAHQSIRCSTRQFSWFESSDRIDS